MAKPFIITIDQGTTGSRVFLISERGEVLESAYEEFTQYFPRAGWVEHNANEIWSSVSRLLAKVLENSGLNATDAVAIGITNQRETTVVWEKKNGAPIHNAIVWQCRRTADYCEELKKEGLGNLFRDKTGLVLDAYFSGTKIKYILDTVPQAREKASRGDLLFGTIDSFLLYKLTGEHKTDFTNASRTLIFNIHERKWDSELCKILNIPENILPEAQPSKSLFGKTKGLQVLPDGIPVYSMIGDQQSALYGQLCHNPGEAKNTYGTGCFVVMNLGDKFLQSKNGLITTLACDTEGNPVYALEGSIFIGGAVVQWLRDKMQFFDDSKKSEMLAKSVAMESDVVFVPAFAGLGAPYWDQDARGAIMGLTRDTTAEQITQAALKAIALQSYDVISAMQADSGLPLSTLKVDGGATSNRYLMEFQAGILGAQVVVPRNAETTVLGAAYLAGLGAKLWTSSDDLRKLNPAAATYHAVMSAEQRERELARWKKAVARVLTQ
ncbi:MAG TPA: glycerol kinase GlpK [Turneriella sp.]|nr:glycerol kinase GlpK [Turneriella sp.]